MDLLELLNLVETKLGGLLEAGKLRIMETLGIITNTQYRRIWNFEDNLFYQN